MRILVLAASVALLGCGAPHGGLSPRGQVSTVEVVQGDQSRLRVESVGTVGSTSATAVAADVAWALLPQAFAEIGLSGRVLDEGERVYGATDQGFRRRLGGQPLSRYLDCGARLGMQNADSYSVRLTVRTQVTADGDGSLVRTEVVASARETGRSDPPVRCGSTSELERRILALLRP
jgi:hypothetical protein